MYIKSYSFCSLILAVGLFLQKQPAIAEYELLPYSLDTDTLFVPNDSEGWGNYFSYFEVSGDSVRMELILSRSVPENTNWQQPSLTGTITSAFRPGSEQTITYSAPERVWELQVLTNGNCYVKYVSGKLPAGDPVIIPIQTTYKK
jgi:hypothetical protein